MDTSKEYLKMCANATEIQEYFEKNMFKLRPYFLYDLLLERVCVCIWCPKKLREKLGQEHEEHIVSIEENNDANVYYEEGTISECYWLPRQDQLQDMVLKESSPAGKASELYYWLPNGYSKYASMEQLWLVFVMEEMYDKLWDGEHWK